MRLRIWIALVLLIGIGTVHAQTPGVCPGFVTELAVGAQGRVLPGTPNNLREQANVNAARIGVIPGDGVFDVLEGPVCADGYTWWRVQYQGTTGWTVEGTPDARFITTTTAGAGGGGISIAGGTSGAARTIPADVVHGLALAAQSSTSVNSTPAPGNICVAVPRADGSGYQPTITSGIGAFALPEYSLNSLHFAISPGSTPPIQALDPGTRAADVTMLNADDPAPAFGFAPAICVVDTSGSASAVSPNGENVTPYLQGLDGITQVQLPPRAYLEPGDWRLLVGTFEVTIPVVAPPPLGQPTRWIGGAGSPDAFVILGGYGASEQIVVIADDGEVVQAQTNRDGYAAAQFQGGAQHVTGIVPENGRDIWIAQGRIGVPSGDQPRYWIPVDLSRSVLYNTIWQHQPFDAGTWRCPDAMPIQMVIGVHYTTTTDHLNMRETPGTASTVVHTLVRGDPVTAQDGVECADRLAWWLVATQPSDGSTPVTGWVAEGMGGEYFFQPGA